MVEAFILVESFDVVEIMTVLAGEVFDLHAKLLKS
jgi:hypothetical protein